MPSDKKKSALQSFAIIIKIIILIISYPHEYLVFLEWNKKHPKYISLWGHSTGPKKRQWTGGKKVSNKSWSVYHVQKYIAKMY